MTAAAGAANDVTVEDAGGGLFVGTNAIQCPGAQIATVGFVRPPVRSLRMRTASGRLIPSRPLRLSRVRARAAFLFAHTAREGVVALDGIDRRRRAIRTLSQSTEGARELCAPDQGFGWGPLRDFPRPRP